MKPIAILDIGSSKVVCLCGSSVHGDGILVHGVGQSSYSGYDGGEFSDEESLHDAVMDAIQQAEQQSRSRIREIALSVPAVFTKVITTQATILVENKRITEEDLERVFSKALEKAPCPGHLLMHATPVCFMVNGVETEETPLNERANELSAYISHMYADEKFVMRFEKLLSSMEIEISMCLSATLSEAIHIIPPEQRVRPAILIDVGYTQTEVSVIENSAMVEFRTIDMGGYQFANDLSFGLDIPLEYAEQVKRRYAFLQEPLSKVEIVRMTTGVKRFDHDLVKLIIESRADELCTLISKALAEMDIRPEMRPALYLTGGGISPMRSSGDYMRKKLGIPVKRDIPSYLHEMNAPNFTSAFGALDFVLRTANEQSLPDADENKPGSLLDRIRNFLNKE